ncbi:MAG: hypothetical protein OEZ10_06975 [Gammaproteobacteria bacterium]|nr:hypothetical protein [Gammaproteobacteria bacterium]
MPVDEKGRIESYSAVHLSHASLAISVKHTGLGYETADHEIDSQGIGYRIVATRRMDNGLGFGWGFSTSIYSSSANRVDLYMQPVMVELSLSRKWADWQGYASLGAGDTYVRYSLGVNGDTYNIEGTDSSPSLDDYQVRFGINRKSGASTRLFLEYELLRVHLNADGWFSGVDKGGTIRSSAINAGILFLLN